MNKEGQNWIIDVKKKGFTKEQIKDAMEKENYTEKTIGEYLAFFDKLYSPTIKPPKKQKGFFERAFNKDKMRKTGKVAVVYLRSNRLAAFKEIETKDDEFFVDGHKYHVDKDCVYVTEKDRIPLMIVRDWDILPLGTKAWEDDNMRDKFSKLENHVLRGIKNIELYKNLSLGGGIKMTPKQMILWGIVILVGAIILINYL